MMNILVCAFIPNNSISILYINIWYNNNHPGICSYVLSKYFSDTCTILNNFVSKVFSINNIIINFDRKKLIANAQYICNHLTALQTWCTSSVPLLLICVCVMCIIRYIANLYLVFWENGHLFEQFVSFLNHFLIPCIAL